MFDLTDEQRQIGDLAAEVAAREIAPHSARWDREAALDPSIYRRMGEMGFLGMLIPPDYDGLGLDTWSYL
ncbi:MAG: acyl-CoA dehydrogenase family protein, partial [Candidatus Eremiobacteraeota bacterium]|nr:acyl-CoA dehydrogenase family protein [Candidatus Eremiobacteraeota bacterium]